MGGGLIGWYVDRMLYRNDMVESGSHKMKCGANSVEHGVDGRGLWC